MDQIEKITKKFYTSEEERQIKLEKYKIFITYFIRALYNFIMSLYNEGIKFHVFHFQEKTIHVGLFPCCSHVGKEKITPAKRLETEEQLHKLGFEHIIWEDLNE